MKEAQFYEQLDDDKVRCRLCPHNCLIYPGRVGICFVRQNIAGKLYALSYGRISAQHLDPIEKKPLFEFYPGSQIFSVSSIGCSLACPYCQNWELAHPKSRFFKEDPETVIEKTTSKLSPRQAVDTALNYKKMNNIGIAYTFNEPLIWYEYLSDTAKIATENGLKNVVVTNGYLNPKPLMEILPFIDAVNIDIKGFNDNVYKRLGGKLKPVLESAALLKTSCHVEVTNLLVPKMNTDEEEIRSLVNWIADNLGSDTPLHFSRYFPSHKMNVPPTPISVLEKARQLGEERLKHVYLGNV